MKTNPDREELLGEVFSETVPPAFRQASLNRALVSVRRQRTSRRVWRATLAIAVVVATVMLFGNAHRDPNGPPGRSAHASAPPPPVQTVPGTDIRLLNDDELLALFPDRPVALIGPPEHCEFVFLDDLRLRTRELSGRRTSIKL